MTCKTATRAPQQKPIATLTGAGLLQRKCACGTHTMAGGDCEECSKKKRSGLQTKLRVNEPGDLYEQEADRIADQLMAAPAHHAVNGTPPHIQRFSGQPTGQMEVALAKVDQALDSPGRPLESVLRQNLEQRFDHDFSRVRVHTGAVAEQSARDVNAHAYTVGGNMVFGEGRFAPGTQEGRRLLGHECMHVVQQLETPQWTAMVQRQPSGSGSAPSSPPASAIVFHPGVNHGHKPSGRWADVQAKPNSGFWENRVCKNFSPKDVIEIAIYAEFSDKPLALQHLLWYLIGGGGADFVEDANLDSLLRIDTGVQALLAKLIPSSTPTGGRFAGNVKVEQSDYQDQDFRFSFGAIDRLDFQVDFTAGTVHAWFQDRYEWHPVYPGLYTVFSDDVVRETNCVHAALVEEKTRDARDFWMKGEATVPLSLFRGGTPPPHPHPKGAGGVLGGSL